MERVLTRWWQRAGRRWPVVALLAVLAATGGAVAQAASSPNHPAARHPAVHTAQANAEAATSDAASLLASLNLPSDAVRQAAEPADDDGTLAQPVSAPATPNAVDDHTWWVLPGTTSQVLQYVKSHPPPGDASDFSGGSGGGGKPTVTATGFQWKAIPGELSIRWLIVAVVRLQDGSTGVRADSEVVWITPRPPSERIPRGARRVVITDTRGGKVVQGPFTVTSRATVARIVSLLNGLPAWQPGTYSCPADFGWRIRVTFYRSVTVSTTPPLAVALAAPSGCGVVQLRLNGRRQPPLADGSEVSNRVSRLLRVKLDSGAP
jgi:hypothetical protein